MITQILYKAPSKHYATMVTVLKLEMAKGKLDLEEIKQTFRTIYGTVEQSGGIRKEAAFITRQGTTTSRRNLRVIAKGAQVC
jgi:phosphoribosylformimino-5-aminoimidazole carboxamide ribonucleotide (ProFAR) isomerase